MKKFNILGTIAVVILALFISSCGGSKSPGKIEVSFWEQVQKKNYDKAADILIDNSTMAVNGGEKDMLKQYKSFMSTMLAAGQSEVESKGGIKKVELVSEDIEGDDADVTVRIIYGDGSDEEVDAEYEKVNGKWVKDIDMGK